MIAPPILAAVFASAADQADGWLDVKTAEGLARFFVSACLDGKVSMPQGYRPVSAAEAAMPPNRTLRNARYYRLNPAAPTFLRIADVVGGRREGVVHFCELRARRIDLPSAWPIVAAAVDPRINARSTKNIDYYEIDYPAQRYRVALTDQYFLVETLDERTASERMRKLKYPDQPSVNRTDLPY